jgi:hypothetical protein
VQLLDSLSHDTRDSIYSAVTGRLGVEPLREIAEIRLCRTLLLGAMSYTALMHPVATATLIALQCFVVLFVALHNWIPLGALNNVRAVRVVFPTGKLFGTTLTNFVPFAVGLAATIFFNGRPYPGWVYWWLWITYRLACYGSFKAWWMLYLLRPDPALVARYRIMYNRTHSFLPEHNGIRPDTLHVLFDVVTIAILINLVVLTA